MHENTRGICVPTVRTASLCVRATPNTCQHLYQQRPRVKHNDHPTTCCHSAGNENPRYQNEVGGHCLFRWVLFDGLQQTHAAETNLGITRNFVKVQHRYL